MKSQEMEFIVKNINFLDDYDMTKIFKKIFVKVFTSKTGLHLDENGKFGGIQILVKKQGYSSPESWTANFDISVDDNVLALKTLLTSFGITWLEFKDYEDVSYLWSSYYFRRGEKSFSVSTNGVTSLIYFLRYLVNGKPDKDLKESNDFLSERKIGYNQGNYEYTIGNIRVKSFINGRLDIKGLTEEQDKIIARFTEIHKILTGR